MGGHQMLLLKHQKNDKTWLRRKTKPDLVENPDRIIRSVELFAGAGGLSLGLSEYCRRVGFSHKIEFAAEWNEDIMDVFLTNNSPTTSSTSSVDQMFDGKLKLGRRLTKIEKSFVKEHPHAMNPDVLMGGPPCQGHSNHNNYTRRTDDRNKLYLRMVRAAQVLKPSTVIIENVRDVEKSEGDEVNIATKRLKKMGYHVEHKVLCAAHYGVAQMRYRHFLIASNKAKPEFHQLLDLKVKENRSVLWAISDLKDKCTRDGGFNSTTVNPSKLNQQRMDWLIDNDEYNMVKNLKPDCHKRNDTHPSVYGRMYGERPSSTITAGFTSNGQGRYTHPTAKPGRTITPHEAARIQSFPDWYKFPDEKGKREVMKKSIGNAVPPLLGLYVSYVAIQTLL